MAKRRRRAQVDKLRRLVLAAMDGTVEGKLLKHLMDIYPLGETVSGFEKLKYGGRQKVQRAADELVRRGFAFRVEAVHTEYGGPYPGYKFGSLRFPDLEY